MTMTKATALTPELLRLMDHEKGIEQGVADVGWHLTAIRDGQFYRAAGYATFDDYCRERWGWQRAHAYRMIQAYEVVAQLSAPQTSPIGDTRPPEVLPRTEGQIRPLVPLRDEPEALRAAWDLAVEEAEAEQPTAQEVSRAVETVQGQREPKRLSKPDVGTGVSHPATFSAPLLPVFAELLVGYRRVLDPFAGTGKIHLLGALVDGIETVGVEIEPEWAACHPKTSVGNALALEFKDASFDAICTSPTYGNRLADSHDAYDAESRRSYTHDLGRKLAADNSGAMQWGNAYREFHAKAWAEAVRVLRPGGRFVVNVKDHVRAGVWQDVPAWHVRALEACGLAVSAIRPVEVSSLRVGDNSDLRATAELVIALDKPS